MTTAMDIEDHQIESAMRRAIAEAESVRTQTSPNPWVGAVLLDRHGDIVSVGATNPPGGPHAEVVALDAAPPGAAAHGTLVVTLEPCSHHGRTPPCADRIVAEGLDRVVVAVLDPDPAVSGAGLAHLGAAGLEVRTGVLADTVAEQLAPYLHHRRTGRPYVVLKMAATLDGGVAAPDGSSTWITGDEARRDVHRLRARSDAVLVGAGTVRVDDPQLTVRDAEGPDPRRIVLGRVPEGARVQPCLEWTGDPGDLIDLLGTEGVLQLLVEGGPTVAADLHARGLIDRYVVYIAPAFFGGSGARPVLDGVTAPTMEQLWRGRLVGCRQVGDDIRVDIVPR